MEIQPRARATRVFSCSTFRTSNPGNSVQILGLVNDDDGLPSVPEADIIPIASSVDSNINEYVLRQYAAAVELA